MTDYGPGAATVSYILLGTLRVPAREGAYARRNNYRFEAYAPHKISYGEKVYVFKTWGFSPNGSAPEGFVLTQSGYQLSDEYHYTIGGGSAFQWIEYVEDSGGGESTRRTVIAVAMPSAGAASVLGSGVYDLGDTCHVSITVADGYRFLYWKSSEGDTQIEKSFSFIVTRNIVWIAYLKKIDRTLLIVRNGDFVLHGGDGPNVVRDE